MRKVSDILIGLLFFAASAALFSCSWYVCERAWGLSKASEVQGKPCKCATPCCPCEPEAD